MEQQDQPLGQAGSRPTRTAEPATPCHDQAEQRLFFLSEASKLLAVSLDYEATLATVAHLAVPQLGDWCSVDLVDAEGAIRHAGVAHADPAREEQARELRRRYPLRPDGSRGAPRVIRTGESELYAEISGSSLAEAARDGEHRRLLQELGVASAIVAPLVARGRTFGAITLVRATPGRRYGPDDLGLVEELARRAATAIDNARLYHEAQRELAERRRAEEAIRTIAGRARCLLWYADVEDRGGKWLYWELKVFDEEAAQRFFPVRIPPGCTYVQAWYQCRLPEDKARMAYGDRETRAGRSYGQEFRCRRADGELRWLAEDVEIETLGPGRWRAVGVCMDITERKQAEQALRESEERLRFALAAGSLGTWEWNIPTGEVKWRASARTRSSSSPSGSISLVSSAIPVGTCAQCWKRAA